MKMTLWPSLNLPTLLEGPGAPGHLPNPCPWWTRFVILYDSSDFKTLRFLPELFGTFHCFVFISFWNWLDFLKINKSICALISEMTQFWRGCTSWDSGEVWQRPGWCHWGPLRGVCLHHGTILTLTMILIIIYHRPHHKGKAVYQQSCGARQNQAAPASHPGWSEW